MGLIPLPYKLGALAVVVALFVAGGLYARHEHNRAIQLEARAKNAEAQSKLDVQTGQIADTYRETTRIIIQQQEAKADAVQAIPSDNLPDDVRDAWLRGMLGTINPADTERTEQPAR